MSKINGVTYGTYPSIRPRKNVDKSVCENCNICKSKPYQLADSLERMHICKNSGCNLFYFSQTSIYMQTFVAYLLEFVLLYSILAKVYLC